MKNRSHAIERLALSVEEAAESVSIGRTIAWQLVRRGEWPTVRVGRRIIISVHDLERWLATQKEEGTEHGKSTPTA